MRAFVRRHLSPADRLGEALFGLVMALGFTGAVRWAGGETDSKSMFRDILGCNIAWGIVDGVMYALGELFERGRSVRLARAVHESRSEAEALACVGLELDDRLDPLIRSEDKEHVHRWVLARIRSEEPQPASPTRGDLAGATAVAAVVITATLPVVVPYLFVEDVHLAVRLSHGVAVAELGLLGAWWARIVGARTWRISLALSVLGLLLAGVTVLLGG